MNFLVAYDVQTVDRDGPRRLRQVAKACEGYGQRVQYSLFEVVCSRSQFASLATQLESIMDPSVDSIRIYPLEADGLERVIHLGRRRELPEDAGWIL